jgi:ribonucleoside-triphosphate reductase
MYPDWLSLTGEGYVAEIYKKYGLVISPMGCRAFLSAYYEIGKLLADNTRDHFFPAEDMDDKPYFVGRFNGGAISLHLPLIYLTSRVTGQDFYDLLDEYLLMIRKLHLRTKDYIGNLPAMINPLGFCEGGFRGGNLKPWQKLKESRELMESTTYSFGVTALNELQQAFNGKSIAEDGRFALEVMKHINNKIAEFKEEDHVLYAIYGTPAESLCGRQVAQLRAYTRQYADELMNATNSIGEHYDVQITERGYVIPNISDREYVSNSFHCHVTEDLTGVEKQDLEYRFWDLFNGGKIQYVRYPVKNKKAIETMLLRAMKMGFYEGVNMALSYCDDCGHQDVNLDDVCPICGSKHITKIDRMNGYLAYSRVKGHTRLNDAKMAEIAERKSM